jgi:hypothetical protein
LDVDEQERYNPYYGRSYDGVSPERMRRSPRFEFHRDEERHSPYRREDRSRPRSRDRRGMGQYDDWFEYRGRERSDPHRSARECDSGYERNSHDEKYSHDHGFYESGSDYDEEYEDANVYSDEYESPPYYGQESRRHRRQIPRGQGRMNYPASHSRKMPRYEEDYVRSHREKSPEEKQRQKVKSRGFDTNFGIYGGPGSKPPPLTLKEYNEEQKKQRKKRRRKPKRRSALYDMLDQNVEYPPDYPPELPPALKTLATYGKMFHGELLQDALHVEREGRGRCLHGWKAHS